MLVFLLQICVCADLCIPDDVQVLNKAGDFFVPNELPNDTSVYKVFDYLYTQLKPLSKKTVTRDVLFFDAIHKKLDENMIDGNVYRWFLEYYYGFLQVLHKTNNQIITSSLANDDVSITFLIERLGETEDERELLMLFVDLFIKEVTKNNKKYEKCNSGDSTNYEYYLQAILNVLYRIKKELLEINLVHNKIVTNLLIVPSDLVSNAPSDVYLYVNSAYKRQVGNARRRHTKNNQTENCDVDPATEFNAM